MATNEDRERATLARKRVVDLAAKYVAVDTSDKPLAMTVRARTAAWKSFVSSNPEIAPHKELFMELTAPKTEGK